MIHSKTQRSLALCLLLALGISSVQAHGPRGYVGRPLWMGQLLRPLAGACHRRHRHRGHIYLHVSPLRRGATQHGLYQHATTRRHQ
jgi:hypothetical protein